MKLTHKFRVSLPFPVDALLSSPDDDTVYLYNSTHPERILNVQLGRPNVDIVGIPSGYFLQSLAGQGRLVLLDREMKGEFLIHGPPGVSWTIRIPIDFRASSNSALDQIIFWSFTSPRLYIYDATKQFQISEIDFKIGSLYGVATDHQGKVWGNFAPLNFLATIEKNGELANRICPWSSQTEAYSPNRAINHPERITIDSQERLWVFNQEGSTADISVISPERRQFARFKAGLPDLRCLSRHIAVSAVDEVICVLTSPVDLEFYSYQIEEFPLTI